MSTSASSFTRKLAGGTFAALTVVGALAFSAAPAAASPRHHGWHHHHHHGVHGQWVRPRHHCWFAPRRIVDRFGHVHVRHVRVCR